jgi:hypothetical protein
MLSDAMPLKGNGMASNYEPIAKERFEVEPTSDGAERIRIRARRPIFPLLFLPIWLVGWTVGGVVAIRQVMTAFEPFLMVWLCGWAFGWIVAAGTIVWMFAGSETLRIVGSDLEVAHQALGWSSRRTYQGSQIRNLSVGPQTAWQSSFTLPGPFAKAARIGSVRFDYGPRTIYVASGLDEAEGRMIVERLARRLPRTVRD